MVRFIDESVFERIKMPSHKCFLKDFEEWQIINDFPKAGQYYEYPKILDDANKILQGNLPKICLIKEDGKWLIDVERFAKEISNC